MISLAYHVPVLNIDYCISASSAESFEWVDFISSGTNLLVLLGKDIEKKKYKGNNITNACNDGIHDSLVFLS